MHVQGRAGGHTHTQIYLSPVTKLNGGVTGWVPGNSTLRQRLTCRGYVRRSFWRQHLWKGRGGKGRKGKGGEVRGEKGRGGEGRVGEERGGERERK